VVRLPYAEARELTQGARPAPLRTVVVAQILPGGAQAGQRPGLLVPVAELASQRQRRLVAGPGLRRATGESQRFTERVVGAHLAAPVADLLRGDQCPLVPLERLGGTAAARVD